MQNRGSTLLLAMVIISTVLFAGIGASIIISRQVGQISSIENREVGRYVAKSIADAISLGKGGFELTSEFKPVDWSDMGIEREVMYKAEEVGNNYIIMMKVGNEYYRFVEERVSDSESFSFYVYYYNQNTWPSVDMWYRKYVDGSPITSWGDNEEGSSSPSDYYYYIYENDNIDDCFSSPPPIFSICDENAFYVYYYNQNTWPSVDMWYRKYVDGSPITSWGDNIEVMESSDYSEWKKKDIQNIEENVDEIRFGFGEEGSSSPSDYYYYIYENDNIDDCFSSPPPIFSICH